MVLSFYKKIYTINKNQQIFSKGFRKNHIIVEIGSSRCTLPNYYCDVTWPVPDLQVRYRSDTWFACPCHEDFCTPFIKVISYRRGVWEWTRSFDYLFTRTLMRVARLNWCNWDVSWSISLKWVSILWSEVGCYDMQGEKGSFSHQ